MDAALRPNGVRGTPFCARGFYRRRTKECSIKARPATGHTRQQMSEKTIDELEAEFPFCSRGSKGPSLLLAVVLGRICSIPRVSPGEHARLCGKALGLPRSQRCADCPIKI